VSTSPATALLRGMTVMTSGGPRVLTWVGEYESFGMRMWGWRWPPAPRQDGLYDCGYSGVRLDLATHCQVHVVDAPAARVQPAGAA
jgi:hypothetical protein